MEERIGLELEFTKNRIHLQIDDRCNDMNMYLSLKYNLRDVKKVKSKEDVNGKHKSITKYVPESDYEIVNKILKLRGYDKYGNVFTSGFVCVIIDFDGDNVNSVCVKHDIPKTTTKDFILSNSIITGLPIALNYFEKI